MAKVNVNFDKRKLGLQLTKEINKVIDSREMKREVGVFLTDRIRFQARIEKPLNNNGVFPDLEANTVFNREYLQSYNVTHRTYAGGRSNLTFTGQFLNSVAFNIAKRQIALFYRGQRKPYKTGPNSTAKKTPSNDQLAGFLKKLGFVVFSKKGIEGNKKINRQINTIIRRFLRRSLGKR